MLAIPLPDPDLADERMRLRPPLRARGRRWSLTVHSLLPGDLGAPAHPTP
jgi:hypothetical protein